MNMTRQEFIGALGASCGMFALAPKKLCADLGPKMAMKPLGVNRVTVNDVTSGGAGRYDVAAYVWPAYQPEPRWAELGIFDAGKGEWQNVWEAVPKWEGHRQPLVPLYWRLSRGCSAPPQVFIIYKEK